MKRFIMNKELKEKILKAILNKTCKSHPPIENITFLLFNSRKLYTLNVDWHNDIIAYYIPKKKQTYIVKNRFGYATSVINCDFDFVDYLNEFYYD